MPIKIFKYIFKKLIGIMFLFTMLLNITRANDSTVMPIEFSQGMPSSYVAINNKSIPLLLDSGAAIVSLVLSKDVLKNLNVTYTGETHCMRTLDGRYCMKKFTIPSVKVGDFVLYNVPGEELKKLWGGSKDGFIETQASKNGVIGLALLRQFNVLLDYKNHEITYFKHKTYPKNLNLASCHLVKTDFVHGIVADYFFNNKNNKMVLDTGSTSSTIKSGTNKVFYPCEPEHVNDFKNCRINKISLFRNQKPENFYVEDLNLPFDGIIGSTYIQNHKIFIASDKNIVYFC